MSVQRTYLLAAALAAGMTLTAGAASAGQCRDPWVTQAITEVTGRAPTGNYESGDCTYTQYNGGHWNSYAQLKGAVAGRLGGGSSLAFNGSGAMSQSTFNSLPKQTYNGQRFALYNGKWMKIVASGAGNWNLISNDGASIVTNASGN